MKYTKLKIPLQTPENIGPRVEEIEAAAQLGKPLSKLI